MVALLCLSSWCRMMVVWLFLTMPRVCLQFVIDVFPDPTHLPFQNEVLVEETIRSDCYNIFSGLYNHTR